MDTTFLLKGYKALEETTIHGEPFHAWNVMKVIRRKR